MSWLVEFKEDEDETWSQSRRRFNFRVEAHRYSVHLWTHHRVQQRRVGHSELPATHGISNGGFLTVPPTPLPTLNVRNEAQKLMFDSMLRGQITDGNWEAISSLQNSWRPWAGCSVVVEPTNLGRDFHANYDKYDFVRANFLAGGVGAEMLELVRTIDDSYTWKDMLVDLRDLKKIKKIQRRPVRLKHQKVASLNHRPTIKKVVINNLCIFKALTFFND